MYDRDYYLKNKEKFLEWQRQYRKKNKERVIEHRKEYYDKPEVKERRKLLKKEWKQRNKEKVKKQNRKDLKKWYYKNRERLLPLKREQTKIYYQKNREKIREYEKNHSQIPEVKARRRYMESIRRKKNPRSNRSLPLDLQFAMNQVRKRDGNKCKWQGCNLTFKEAPIHIHHIFPISEYPELQYEQRYMISYCANHHGLFHRYKGDPYS